MTKLEKVLPSYIATVFLFIITYFITVKYLILSIALCLIILGIFNNDLGLLIIISFVIGFLSDIFINLASNFYNRKFKNSNRAKGLQIYFKSMGMFRAALFAGVLTAIMISNTYAITESFDEPLDLWIKLLIGFGVGALWGAVGNYSLGYKPFKVFYDNTSGYLENRIWDGITIPFALLVIELIL